MAVTDEMIIAAFLFQLDKGIEQLLSRFVAIPFPVFAGPGKGSYLRIDILEILLELFPKGIPGLPPTIPFLRLRFDGGGFFLVGEGPVNEDDHWFFPCRIHAS